MEHFYSCIVADRSDGKPIGVVSFPGTDDSTVANLLENIAQREIDFTTVHPPQDILALPDGLDLGRADTVHKLHSIRADWREISSKCRSWHSKQCLSNIRDLYKNADNRLYMIAFCDVINQSAGLTLPSIIEEVRRNFDPVSRPSVAASIRGKLKPPSISANNDRLIETERPEHNEAVYGGRPYELTGPSIAIYHPIFAEFQQLLSRTPSPGDIPADTLEAASSFILASAQYHPKELDRQRALAQAVVSLLGSVVFEETTIQYGTLYFKPDGHKKAECGVFRRLELGRMLMLALLAKVKNGIGQGSRDPIEEGAKGYLIVATAPELEKLRSRSCIPAFLLGISGPYITVSGAIYVDGVITERLTDMISLVPVLSSQSPAGHPSAHDTLSYQVAHLFESLRICLEKLAAEYLSMSDVPIDPDILCPKPHFSSFSDGAHQYELTYRHSLFENSRSSRTVFLADATSGQAAQLCAVKFTPRYCRDAHNLVHLAGAAPKLLYCEFEPTVGKFCVVTEYINEMPGARLTEDGIKRLKQAVSVLHSQSYVFGDLRDANILVDQKGNPYLIDFDWSGVEGSVFYPVDLNMQGVEWAEGVHGGGKITRGHDEAMLKQFLASH